MTRLVGAAAVVTGASSGIGRAIALALGRRGARVVAGGRTGDRLEAVAAAIGEAGSEARARVVDVRRDEDLAALIGDAVSVFGRLDVMVNAAGVGVPGPVAEGSTASWREMLETNVLATCVGCREAARAMAGRGGTIVNVSSDAGRRSTPGDAVYSASKSAVSAFSRSLGDELAGSGTRVLLVEPGQVMTSFGRHAPRAVVEAIGAALGLAPDAIPDFRGRHVPEDFAREVIRRFPDRFLAPDAVAEVVADAVGRDDEAFVGRITIRPGPGGPLVEEGGPIEH